MRPNLMFFVMILGCGPRLSAQKLPIDTGVLGNVPRIQGEVLSNDGAYAAYQTTFEGSRVCQLYVRENNTNRLVVSGQPVKSGIAFSEDSKAAFYINNGDSLCKLNLGAGQMSFIPDVRIFQLSLVGNWIVYLSKAGVCV